MALETLANQILALVNWGITILVLMLIWEIYQFIRGGAEAGPLLKAGGGMDNFWKGVKARIPGTAAQVRRVQKKELNEYILEEREETELDKLKAYALHLVTQMEAIANRSYFTRSEQVNLVQDIRGFGELFNQVKRYFRSLNKRTSREQSGLDKFFQYVKKKGIEVPEEVKALENNILKLHQQTGQDIAGVEELYREILNSKSMKILESMTTEMFGGATYKIDTKSEPFKLGHLYELIKGFRKEEFLLEDAYKRQAEAKKEMQGIIAETRGLYE